MSIWGKLAGAAAGLAIGGPIGGLLRGFAGGHVFDRDRNKTVCPNIRLPLPSA